MTRTLVALALLQLGLVACATEPSTLDSPRPTANAAPDPAQPAPDALMDPELMDFLQRAEFFLRRFLTVAPDQKALDRAMEEGEEGLLALLEIQTEEGRMRYRGLQRDASALLARHPELESEVDRLLRSGAPPCELQELRDLARRLGGRGIPESRQPKSPYVECRTVPYLATLVLCTASGNPWVYLACATVAMCNFCSGGIVDRICGG